MCPSASTIVILAERRAGNNQNGPANVSLLQPPTLLPIISQIRLPQQTKLFDVVIRLQFVFVHRFLEKRGHMGFRTSSESARLLSKGLPPIH
jgi:hypothetical protein